jgi:hypothetical protein
MEHAKYLGQHEKTKPTNHRYRGKEDIQIKGIYSLFNKVIAENFPNLTKGPSR